MGVYIGELQLAATPCLGDWKITVNVDEEVQPFSDSQLIDKTYNELFQTSEKVFEVAEYVLPKFEVTVIGPKAATYADGELTINVKAVYTYGENVKGVAVVVISRNNYWDPTPQPPIAQKQVDINGNAVAQFKMDSELKISSQNWQDDFKVTASVTEALTGSVNQIYKTIIDVY